MYNPHDWYWLANGGRLFSSSRNALVSTTDAQFKAWKKQGIEPTVWPSDGDGNQSDVELQTVLAPYGITVSANLLDAARLRRINDLTVRCADEIVGGYQSDALGLVHTYPSKQVDQLNMMGSVTDALTPGQTSDWSTPFWCSDAAGQWAFRLHSAPQIIAAGQAGKAHVVTCQTTLASLSAQVLSAGTVEEIDALTWPAA